MMRIVLASGHPTLRFDFALPVARVSVCDSCPWTF